MERTAARFVSSFCVAKTFSLRFTRALGDGRSSLSRYEHWQEFWSERCES